MASAVFCVFCPIKGPYHFLGLVNLLFKIVAKYNCWHYIIILCCALIACNTFEMPKIDAEIAVLPKTNAVFRLDAGFLCCSSWLI